MGLRRKARELALQVLFQQEFSPDMDRKKSLASFKANFPFPQEVWDYAELVLNGIADHSAEIDRTIDRYSSNWSSQRMALVDLNILRIAVCELRFLKEIPPQKTVINEAIEISKKYGGTDSYVFVNGILGKMIVD